MAFNTISSSLIAVGKAITASLFTTVKDNFDDLDTRMTGLEGAAGKIIIYDEIVVNAATLASGGTITGLDIWRSPSTFNLTDAKVYIFTKGSLTGNIEIDVRISSSPDFTANVSAFTTKPKVVYSTASDYEVSANTVFDNTNKVISAGDYIRLDISELPGGGTIGKFGVYLIGEAS